MHFHLALGPVNCTAGPAHLLRQPARAAFPRKSSPASHSLCFQKCYPQSLNGQDRTETSYFNLGWLPARRALKGPSVTSGLSPTLVFPPYPTSPLRCGLPGHSSLNAPLLKGLKFLEGLDTSTLSPTPPTGLFPHTQQELNESGCIRYITVCTS